MIRPAIHIRIQGERTWDIRHVAEATIRLDSSSLTDTLHFALPKKARWDGQDDVPLRRGDRVEASIGYEPDLRPVFRGYIRDVSRTTPVAVDCEDEMFRLKQTRAVRKAYPSATLEGLLQDQPVGCRIHVHGDVRLGQYRVDDDTVAAVLARLGQQGIRAFFRTEDGEPVLHAGVVFERTDAGAPVQVFDDRLNITDTASLRTQRADDVRLRIKAVSILPDGKKIRIETGDPDGEPRTLHAYNKTEAELRAWAEQEAARLKRDGTTGTFTAFCARPADKATAVALRLEGRRAGTYLVERNTITLGTGGLRQEITLGSRIAD